MKKKNNRNKTKLNENETIKSYLWRQESDDGGHVGDKTEESKAEYHTIIIIVTNLYLLISTNYLSIRDGSGYQNR